LFSLVVFAGYFVKKGTLGCLIPVISSGWLLANGSISVIYFSTFHPDAFYETLKGSISYLVGGMRYQLAIFLFLLVYFVSISQLLKKEEKVPQNPLRVSKYLGYATLASIMLMSIFYMLARAAPLPEFLKSWGLRLHIYLQTLWFAVGVVSLRLSRAIKIMMLAFFVFALIFFSLGGERGIAIMPLAAVFCGMFFFSEASTRTKLVFAVSLIVALPWFAVISNATRILLGTPEEQEVRFQDLSYRLAALKEWRYVVKQVPAGTHFFGRLFFTAGNVIVAYSPIEYSYRHFSPTEYAKEAAISMVPRPVRRFIGIDLDITKAQYTGSWILRDYGINVTEFTSVEPSTIGSLWMFGGYIPVLIGGFVLALIHSFIAWVVRHAWTQNPDKGVFYFSVYFSTILWSSNSDLILIWRTVVLQLVFAYFGFKLISPFLKIGYTSATEQYEKPILEGY